MTTEVQTKRQSRAAVWIGWILSVLPALLLIMSGVMKLLRPEMVVKGMEQQGFSVSLAIPLGILEIACTILYLIPRTAVLGAILLTGYMGGAIVTHLRMGDAFVVQVLIGVVVWLGIYLREPRLRAILPVRQ